MKLAGLSLLLGVMLIGVIGCEDDRPIYVTPKLEAKDSAILRGGWGSFVDEIDGARVADPSFRLANFGGNQVLVTPGTHNLVVHTEMNSGPMNTQVTHEFAFRAVAGHTYDMTPNSVWKPSVLRVTDKNTNESLVIEDDPPSGFFFFGVK